MIDKIKKEINDSKKVIYFLLPLVIISIIFLVIISSGVYKTDIYILGKISLFVNDNLTFIMKVITSMCSPVVLLTIVLLSLIFFKDKKISVGITFSLFLSTLANLLLKLIFSRQRPLGFMLINESGYSFPSGHSMVSMAFYGFLIYLCYKNIENRKMKIISILLFSLIVLLIAFSRLYLGVHYPTDVLAGLTFGYIFLYFYIKIFKKYILGYNKK